MGCSEAKKSCCQVRKMRDLEIILLMVMVFYAMVVGGMLDSRNY